MEQVRLQSYRIRECMNERIEKLVGMALDKAVPYTWHNLDHNEVEKVMEKFAELIVRECAHLVGGYTKENEFGTDVKEAYEEITKHFGVEQ